MSGPQAKTKKAQSDDKKLMLHLLNYLTILDSKYGARALTGVISLNGSTTWVLVYSNFLVTYGTNAEPKPPQNKQGAYILPKEICRLERVTECVVQRDKLIFYEARKDKTKKNREWTIKVKDEEEWILWRDKLPKYIEKMRAAWDDMMAHPTGIDEVQSSFPVKFKAPAITFATEDKLKEWIVTMRALAQLARKWEPHLEQWRWFVEVTYKNGPYIDGFLGVGAARGGKLSVTKRIESRAEEGGKILLEKLKILHREVHLAFEQRFFQEDLKDVIPRIEYALRMYDYHDQFRNTVLANMDPTAWGPRRDSLNRFLKYFNSLPPTKSITSAGATGGFADCDELDLSWAYNARGPSEGTVECASTPGAGEFRCLGFDTSLGPYGSVIWNGTSWIWFHPRLMFSIRYNLKKSINTWQFYPGSQHGKYEELGQVILPDWVVSKNQYGFNFKPDYRRLNAPRSNRFADWRTSGSIPDHVVVCVAMLPHVIQLLETLTIMYLEQMKAAALAAAPAKPQQP